MPDPETSREEELRQLLTDAIEVQLAALKAGIGFWSEWIEKTTDFVDAATKTLSNINADDPQTKDVLLELIDAGRASAREMTEIPRNTAIRFIDELDRFEAKKIEAKASKRAANSAGRAKGSAAKSAAKKGTRRTAATTRAAQTAKKTSRSGKKARPKRAGRVKE